MVCKTFNGECDAMVGMTLIRPLNKVQSISHIRLPIGCQWFFGLCSVLRPPQHSIGYMGDGFYRSKDPTNSIKVLKDATNKNKNNTKNIIHTEIQSSTR